MTDLTPETLNLDALLGEYPLNPELAGYELWDREKHLGPPPWPGGDANVELRIWEDAHGHDVRMKCYPEFDCRLVEETHARNVRALVKRIAELEAERDRARDIAVALEGQLAKVQAAVERAQAVADKYADMNAGTEHVRLGADAVIKAVRDALDGA